MQKHKLYSNKQFGFISGRSAVLQLLKVLQEVMQKKYCTQFKNIQQNLVHYNVVIALQDG